MLLECNQPEAKVGFAKALTAAIQQVCKIEQQYILKTEKIIKVISADQMPL